MERTYVRCYGCVASSVSSIIISEGEDGANLRSLLRILRGIRREPDHYFGGERWSELTFAATDSSWHPA
jgi:hypothetical protein